METSTFVPRHLTEQHYEHRRRETAKQDQAGEYQQVVGLRVGSLAVGTEGEIAFGD
jgi:hypothetical protein